MSRKKKKRKPVQPLARQAQSLPKRWFHSVWLKVIAIVGLLITIGGIIGIPSSLASFLTRFDVTVGSTLNPQDPFATSFIVTNVGTWTVREPKIVCLAHEADFDIVGNPKESQLPAGGTALEQRVYRADQLRAGEKATVICQPPMRSLNFGALRRGDIRIHISYRLWPFRFRMQTSFRFVAEKAADGSWQWWHRPVPSGDPFPVTFPGFP